jgi:hypothetical protein
MRPASTISFVRLTGSSELSFHAGFPDAGMWLLKSQCLLESADAARTLERLTTDHADRAATLIELELSEPGSPIQKLRDHPAVVKLLS